ncbi:MAG: SnoK protein [Bacteroidia bacterium]|nr:MAG: SnoK protein [Bacteroidia bacterium]
MSSWLENEYPLHEAACESYRRNGHIFLPGVVPAAEVQTIRPVILGVVDEVAKARDAQGRISDYSSLFTQVTNVWRLNETVRTFVCARRFAGIAARLMGVNGVRLYHDQALIKEPGGRPTPWHQDAYYWPLNTDHTVTMWLALVDIPQRMGTMSFVNGSHRNGSFRPMEISDDSQRYFESIIREERPEVQSYELRAGDATFHSGRTLHSAHANNSDRRREVMTIIYYADGTTVLEPDNEHRKTDLKVFLPGAKPGGPAVSELNPLLYP